MKFLKLVFAVTALAIGFGASIANAQDTKRQSAAQKAKATYNLTDDQYQKVDAIYKDAAKQKRAVPTSDANKKAKDAEIDNATKAKVREVLTPGQQAKFDEANKKGGSSKGKDAGKAKKDKGGAKKNKGDE